MESGKLAAELMSLRLRFLLDTNILIPLQDSMIVLKANLANFIRLSSVGGHQLLYHPASRRDIARDGDVARRTRTLQRLGQYTELEAAGACPWNDSTTGENDSCDNEILYALYCDAAHALVTEDQGLHTKARKYGLESRVYTIQTAEDWLRRLHEPTEVRLPNIEDVALHTLTPTLSDAFFDSLRKGYGQNDFDVWLRKKAQEGRHAWVYRDSGSGALSALCIYAVQENERINDVGDILAGRALKLCTFKVGELVRGRKIGELFLKAAFRYATDNDCQHIFIHGDPEQHPYLFRLLLDFGFITRGSYSGDAVFVKSHPKEPPPPNLPPVDYVRCYFPHYRADATVGKYLVPIQPQYHQILFPDYVRPGPQQLALLELANSAGNAIKLAYLCRTPTRSVQPGDILLFYRTADEQAVTTVGVVDRFEVLSDASQIASLVSRRTVYGHAEIVEMAKRETKVFLFRCIQHFTSPVKYEKLLSQNIVSGPIQSLRRIDDAHYRELLRSATG